MGEINVFHKGLWNRHSFAKTYCAVCVVVHLWFYVFNQGVYFLSARKKLKVLNSFYLHHLEKILTQVPILFCKSCSLFVALGRIFRLETFYFPSFLFKLHIHFSDTLYTVGFLEQKFEMWLSCQITKVQTIWNDGVYFVLVFFIFLLVKIVQVILVELEDWIIFELINKKLLWNWLDQTFFILITNLTFRLLLQSLRLVLTLCWGKLLVSNSVTWMRLLVACSYDWSAF